MKRVLLSLTLLVSIDCSILSQVAILDYNNISAHVHSRGLLFNNNLLPGFEYPKGSGKHLLFSMTDWYGGRDVNNQLKMAASDGGITTNITGDYGSGPLSYNAATPGNINLGILGYGAANIDSATNSQYNKVWVVKKATIDSFIDWSTNSPNWPGYSIPSSILDWPAHSNPTTLDFDFYLAPFVDVDSNGVYNPSIGDFPDIKGDFCAFTIYNDKADIHYYSGSNPIGIEIRQMVYGYITDDNCPNHEVLDATLFIERRVINRSTQTLQNFTMGISVDPDLGNKYDDYIGCDVGRSMAYVYNSDSIDEGSSGYGSNIPALGIVILDGLNQEPNGLDDAVGVGPNESINGSGYGNGVIDDEKLGLTAFTNLFGNNGLSNLNSAEDHFNLMIGNYTNGSTFTDPSGPTKFIYPDDSNPLGYLQGGSVYSPWSELNSGNLSGDRRLLASSGDCILVPGEFHDVKLAVVVGPMKYHGVGSVESLQARVDTLIAIHGLSGDPCTVVGTENINKDQINLYPNPVSHNLTIDGISKNTEIFIYDAFGKLVLSTYNNNTINVSTLKSGIYLVHLKNNNGVVAKRFVKN